MSKRVRRQQRLAPVLPLLRHRGKKLVISTRLGNSNNNSNNNNNNNSNTSRHGLISGSSSSSSALVRNARGHTRDDSQATHSELHVPQTLAGHRRVCGKRPRHTSRDTSSHWQTAADVSLEVSNPSNERIVRLGNGVAEQDDSDTTFQSLLYGRSWVSPCDVGPPSTGVTVIPAPAVHPTYIISPYTGRRLRAVIWQDPDAVPHYRQVLHDVILSVMRRRVRISQQQQQQQSQGQRGIAVSTPGPCNTWNSHVQDEEEREDLRVLFSLSRHSPVTYVPLQPCHIGQVNNLLEREFWPGIDISDALQYPEHGIIAACQHMVVGCALMTPSGYVTFVAVHPHWRRFGVATFMLYFLIKGYPHRDITLHVSANNNAMILYQKFGFKPEEYVRDFYTKFLPANSPDCKHAYLLRLRQQ